MGGNFSCSCGKPFSSRKNRKSSRKFLRDHDSTFKLLLLGAGESGKSTIAKQMNGYTQAERESFVELVHNNILTLMKGVIDGMREKGIEKDVADKLERLIRLGDPFKDCVDSIKLLSQDTGFKLAVKKGNEFNLNETHLCLLEDIDRIAALDYVPSDLDIIKTRMKTSGIYELLFPYKKFTIRLIDVGGQRSERKKWIHCFEDVDALIFVASLVDYCMHLEEDNKINRLNESVKLFESLCNNPFFSRIPIILFLNKKDLFERKIKDSPIQDYFKEYTGSGLESAITFIQDTYLNTNKIELRQIYVHVTDATNTTNIDYVFEAVCDIILNKNLRETGLTY